MNTEDMQSIAGVDEVGRGPLAGPVLAAAVILDPARPIHGLTDSKKISAIKRERLALEIREKAFAWALGRAEVGEIDALNILEASLLAMQRAVFALPNMPHLVLVDGNRCPLLPCASRAIVQGDLTEPAISAASIIAKVARDQEMVDWHQTYPLYGFADHKGYPTTMHLAALRVYGITPLHRRSFAPVRAVLARPPEVVDYA